jgi:tryptophan halogenase
VGRPITNFTIVGGGTAGWIAAAYLNQRLQWGPAAKREGVKITVIESPNIGVIGVGEATVPTIKSTMQYLGISEPEFMSRANATFKLGIWFDRWNIDANGNLNGFLHPFTGGKTLNGIHPAYPFKKHGIPGRENVTDQDFVRAISFVREAFENNLGPRALTDPLYGGPQQYAYHIDAAKLADFLAEVCRNRGVEHVRDNVLDVKLDERGYIASLQLEKNGDWPVELVIDCTGFRGLLINKALGEPFIPFSDYLINDRAIPMQVRHWDPERIPTVTRAIAMDAGWMWHIPLRGRVGAGYVFCSRFKSDDEALAELREVLGSAACEGIEPQPTLNMRVGRNRRCWVKNCVAIGLSGGFLEPLESTAIMTLELQSRMLLHYMPTTDFEEPLADQYNGYVARLYEEVRDFLSLHYSLSERPGPYWDVIRNETRKSDPLRAHLDAWKYVLPSPSDPRTSMYVDSWSIIAVLMGKNFYRDCQLSAGAYEVPLALWQRYCADNETYKRSILKRLASHNELVEHTHAQAAPGLLNVLKKRDEETPFSDAPLISQPQPIMARPPARSQPV